MTRSADVSVRRRLTRPLLDRASLVPAVARARERVRAARAARNPEPLVLGPDGLPLPPTTLRALVGRPDPDWFLARGREAADAIVDAATLEGSVLDFGVGCGRVARYWQHAALDLHGCDINPHLAEWCRRHLGFMQTTVNDLEPRTSYPDDRFDFVYAVSVLTHLPEALAGRWIDEWRRILKPGGTLIVTVHGDRYRDELDRGQRVRYDRGDVVVRHPRLAGRNTCAAFHPASAMRGVLGAFDSVEKRPNLMKQDVYVAR